MKTRMRTKSQSGVDDDDGDERRRLGSFPAAGSTGSRYRSGQGAEEASIPYTERMSSAAVKLPAAVREEVRGDRRGW